MSVAECQTRIDALEYAEWREWWELEPFGEEWRQTATACLVMADAWLKKRGGGKWQKQDFMPGRGEQPEQTPEQIEQTVMAFFGLPANGPR